MKRLLIIFVLTALAMGAGAQGFFTPVTAAQLTPITADSKAGLTGTFLIRPEMTIAGPVLKPKYVDGEFDGLQTSFVSRVGIGASLSLYELVDGQPYDKYSFALQLSLATAVEPNMGLMATASAFNLYGLSPAFGLGYDFIKGSPVKANWFIIWGFNKTF